MCKNYEDLTHHMKKTGFTLVELLIVIATIGILSALLMYVFSSGTKHAVIQHAQSERDQIETALGNYYTYYGFYPPGNANATPNNMAPALINQLYYELEGTTTNINNGGNLISYTTLDNASTITGGLPAATIPNTFGVSGFMNYTKGGSEDSKPAKNFLPGIKAGQIATLTVGGRPVNLLATAAIGDSTYQPVLGAMTQNGHNANPWRYLCPGVNNPNSYDLWLQIMVGGKTYLICNWTTAVQIQ
jgi:prepilin-type N-terminal cleavage/methylation domain-containing protein